MHRSGSLLASIISKAGSGDTHMKVTGMLILGGVDKTRNMEHSGTFRNIPEHPGT